MAFNGLEGQGVEVGILCGDGIRAARRTDSHTPPCTPTLEGFQGGTFAMTARKVAPEDEYESTIAHRRILSDGHAKPALLKTVSPA